MNLDELSQIEDELARAALGQGTLEQKILHNERANLSSHWDRVLGGYVDLINDPEQGQEALRRALFLVWFSYDAPAFETGLGELPKDCERKILERVNSDIESNELDELTQAMLVDFGPSLVFELYDDLFWLNLNLKNKAWPALDRSLVGSTKNRGSMGRYLEGRLEQIEHRASAMPSVGVEELDCEGDPGSPSAEIQDGRFLAQNAGSVCLRCFTPVDARFSYCQECGWLTGESSDYVPYVNIRHNTHFPAGIWKRTWYNDEPTTATKWVRRLPLIIWATLTSPGWLPIYLVAVLPYLLWKRFAVKKDQ